MHQQTWIFDATGIKRLEPRNFSQSELRASILYLHLIIKRTSFRRICEPDSAHKCAEHSLKREWSTKNNGYPIGRHPEGSLRELNSPRSSRASTERPFVEFANRIPRTNARSTVQRGSEAQKIMGTRLGATQRVRFAN